MKVALIILPVAALVAAVAFWWRYAPRRRAWPCPPWLSWVFDNPLSDLIAGSSLLLDRLDLRAGMRVIDVGCGPGRMTLPLARRVGPTGLVVALDIQAGMLHKLRRRVARSGLSNIRPVEGGAGQGLLERDTFDRALMVAVLGEVVSPEAALLEVHGALKPGGLLSVTEFLPDPDYQSRTAVRQLAEAAGFRLDRTIGSWLAFTMNFVKPPR